MNPTGLIRCIAVSPSGNWVALGQASGFLTILDTRTGLIIASWKGHECEVKTLESPFTIGSLIKMAILGIFFWKAYATDFRKFL